MARKLAKSPSESSLSPPPDDLGQNVLAQTAEVDFAVETEVNGRGKKRKAETTVKATKRAKKATVKEEDDAEDANDTEETPKPKKRAAKKAKVEETVEGEVTAGADDNGTEVKKITHKRQTKTKEAGLAPLEERTVGSKLLVGAHVSVAGGTT